MACAGDPESEYGKACAEINGNFVNIARPDPSAPLTISAQQQKNRSEVRVEEPREGEFGPYDIAYDFKIFVYP